MFDLFATLLQATAYTFAWASLCIWVTDRDKVTSLTVYGSTAAFMAIWVFGNLASDAVKIRGDEAIAMMIGALIGSVAADFQRKAK